MADAKSDRVTLEEPMVRTFAMIDALSKLSIARGVSIDSEFKAQAHSG